MKIVAYPNNILRQKSEPVSFENELGLLRTSREMYASMVAHQGVGLAAPQIGLSKRIIVIATREFNGAMFNPEIIHFSRHITTLNEGCLSFVGKFIDITRSTIVTVRYFDHSGQPHTIVLSGLGARVVQHEIEHLEGTLLIDHETNSKE